MIKINPYIVAFEGSNLAGKTTTIKILSDMYKEYEYPILIINEYVTYAHGHENFPNLNPKNNSESIKHAKFFIDLEAKRMMDIQKWMRNYSSQVRPIILVDRLLFTCLAVRREINDIIGYQLILDRLISKNCIIPNITIYLQLSASHEEYQQRLDKRTPFENSEILYRMQDSYEKFFRDFNKSILNLNPVYTSSFQINHIFSTINEACDVRI